jgi:hypothetical protein
VKRLSECFSNDLVDKVGARKQEVLGVVSPLELCQ